MSMTYVVKTCHDSEWLLIGFSHRSLFVKLLLVKVSNYCLLMKNQETLNREKNISGWIQEIQLFSREATFTLLSRDVRLFAWRNFHYTSPPPLSKLSLASHVLWQEGESLPSWQGKRWDENRIRIESRVSLCVTI